MTGIFSQAENAKESQKKAEATDLVSMVLADYTIEKKAYKTDIEDFLEDQKGKTIDKKELENLVKKHVHYENKGIEKWSLIITP